MAYNKANVLIGAATIFMDDAPMGWTNGGVQLEHSADFYEVEVDQEMNPIKVFQTKEHYKVKTNLSETTLENIKAAWGIGTAIDSSVAGYRKLNFGGSQDDPIEHTLDIYGKAPGTITPARVRRVRFHRVVAMEFGTLNIEKNKEQMVPITFTCLVDSTQASGAQIGYILDQTAREYMNLVCRVTVY